MTASSQAHFCATLRHFESALRAQQPRLRDLPQQLMTPKRPQVLAVTLRSAPRKWLEFEWQLEPLLRGDCKRVEEGDLHSGGFVTLSWMKLNEQDVLGSVPRSTSKKLPPPAVSISVKESV